MLPKYGRMIKCIVIVFVFLISLTRLRGICDANFYDDRFVLDGMQNNEPFFRGYYRSEILYDIDGRWKLISLQVYFLFCIKFMYHIK